MARRPRRHFVEQDPAVCNFICWNGAVCGATPVVWANDSVRLCAEHARWCGKQVQS